MNLINKFKSLSVLFKSQETDTKDVNNSTDGKPSSLHPLAIDGSKEIGIIINDLKNSYQKFTQYDEFLRIDESDRLQLLQDVWDNFDFVNADKKIIKKYPQYNENDLELITHKEKQRITTIHRMNRYIEAKEQFLEIYSNKERNEQYKDYPKINKKVIKLCYPKDMPKLFNVWRNEDGRIERYNFNGVSDKDTRYTKEIYLFQNSDYIKMSVSEFKEFCKQNNLIYPLWLPPKEREDRRLRKLLYLFNISVENDIVVTQEIFNQLLKAKNKNLGD